MEELQEFRAAFEKAESDLAYVLANESHYTGNPALYAKMTRDMRRNRDDLLARVRKMEAEQEAIEQRARAAAEVSARRQAEREDRAARDEQRRAQAEEAARANAAREEARLEKEAEIRRAHEKARALDEAQRKANVQVLMKEAASKAAEKEAEACKRQGLVMEAEGVGKSAKFRLRVPGHGSIIVSFEEEK